MRTGEGSQQRSEAIDIAVVGIGCLFPQAAGPGWFWANVRNGVDCIGDVPASHWNPADYFDADPKSPDMTYARRGGFLEAVDFNPLEYGIAPRDLEATDTTQLLGLVAAKQALVDAGIMASPTAGNGAKAPKPVDRDRISVILGVTGTLELVIPLGARLGHPHWKRALNEAGVPEDVAKDVIARIGESYVPWQENSFPGLLGNVVAGRIANRLDLHGTNCVVDAACASSLSAIHLATLELAAGRADVVVSGGADTFNDIFMFMCFSKTPALSPTGNSKPFDASGDGTILGEGLGMVVLKRRADAERDGDTIYAVIKGIGTSSDGKGNAIYAPSAEGQKRCLRNAYDVAGVSPETIELVEAHGTGTKVGDAAEASALIEVFTNDAKKPMPRPWCAIGSVKSQIGHTKAAAGAAGFIKAVLALYNKVLPPTLKVTQPVEPLRSADSPFYVNTDARPWLPRPDHPRRAALSAFGFGGSNFHCVLEEATPSKSVPDWDGSVEIVALSAMTTTALDAELSAMPRTWSEFARVAADSRATFNPLAPHRLLLVAHRQKTDLKKLISEAERQLLSNTYETEWFTSEGAYYGSGPTAGSLAVIFPGQGSQSPGMMRDLVSLFPEALDTLALADAGERDVRLSDRIYPPARFDPTRSAADLAALTDTSVAQPALGAVELAAWRVLNERFGISADAFAGHSFGELTALAAAGRITPADFHRLARLRGRLMANPGQNAASGMLAVLAPIPDIEASVALMGRNLVIANRNAPKQAVLSGLRTDLEAAAKSFADQGIQTVFLPVSAAFHSRFVADAAAPFRSELDRIGLPKSSRPVFANSTAREYPEDPIAARDLLGDQLVKPVLFVEQILAMMDAGCRTFLEVGPGGKLSRPIAEIVATRPEIAKSSACVPLDSPTGRRGGTLDLAHALARLAARGHAVNLAAWERESRCRPQPSSAKPGLTVPICGANYVSPRAKREPRRPSDLPTKAQAMSPANPGPLDPALASSLAAAQQTLAALQKMQEQTAQLHRQFLESQDRAQQTIASLIAQQAGLPGATPLLPAMPAPVATPAPIARPSAEPPNRPMPAVTPAPGRSNADVATPAPVRTVPIAALPTFKPAGIDAREILLQVVAEKTGYPAGMLDPSMALDNDLGVDSIKRVEILSAMQEKLPHAPTVKPEHLGTLRTLQDVLDYLAHGGEATMELPAVVATPAPVKTETARIEPVAAVTVTAAGGLAEGLLEIVAQKTGYPAGMLDLSMALDNDLGIDSIKRVEILSAIQEKYPNTPTVKPEHLGTLRTLQDVVDYLRGTPNPVTAKIPIDPAAVAELTSSLKELQPPPSSRNAGNPPTQSELLAPSTETVSKIQKAVATDSMLLQTGTAIIASPAPRIVEPVADPNKPATVFPPSEPIERSILQTIEIDPTIPRARIALPEGRDVAIVGEDGPFTNEVARQFKTLGYRPILQPWSMAPTSSLPDDLAGLILIAPNRIPPNLPLNRLAFQWIQRAGAKLRSAVKGGGAALLATVSRMDGAFGTSDLPTNAEAVGGGLAGLTKTVRYEWPEISAKAIDIAAKFVDGDPAAAAGVLVEELLMAGPIEVGITVSHRCTLELARTIRRPTGAIPLGANDVILITGGARGVTAEASVALAEATKGTIVLTGRTPPPAGPEPEWLAGQTDEAAMKKAIAEHLGATATPKSVADLYARTISQREIRDTVNRIERTGARVAYYPVNVANGRAVADLLHQVRVKFGPVTALIHGAGVLADKKIEQLTVEQFDTVYSTKADGARNLLDMLRGEELRVIVLFSSTTGRFGRTGQIAYACANEVLNKMAQTEARRRPAARVVSINWGPWEGGMVTPALRKVFEAEGVGLIPMADGGQFVVQELAATGRSVEVIAVGKLKSGASSTLPTSKNPGSGNSETGFRTGPPGSTAMTGTQPPSAPPAAELSVAFERIIDVNSHPVLRSHVLEGRAVLPMAVHLEWLSHAALHGNPGLVFHGIDNLRITAGIQIDDGATVPIKALAGKPVKQERGYVVPVELRGKRRDGREVIHSRAEVHLVASLPKAPTADRPPAVLPYPHPVDEVYKYFLFHGPDLQGIERVDGLTETSFVGSAYPAPSPIEWFGQPLRSNWVADPMVLDASFQMLILWSFAQHGAGSLPCFAGRYRQYRRAFPAGSVQIVARVTRDNGTFARADIDYLDADGTVIAQLQDYECVIDPALNQSFRRNQLGGGLVRN